MQKQTSEKKYIIRNFAEFARKHLCGNLFFAKAKLCNFTKNESLAQVFSCEFCKTYKNTFFAEQHPTTASDYNIINSSEKRIGKQNCKLWYKN